MTKLNDCVLTDINYNYITSNGDTLIRVDTDNELSSLHYLKWKNDTWQAKWLKPFPSPNWNHRDVKDADTIKVLEAYIKVS